MAQRDYPATVYVMCRQARTGDYMWEREVVAVYSSRKIAEQHKPVDWKGNPEDDAEILEFIVDEHV